MRSLWSLPRLLLTLCLLASAWQGFVQQTHVHAASGYGASAHVADAGSPVTPDSGCVLCDAASHSPATAPPAAMGEFLPLTAPSHASEPGEPTAFTSTASHHWLGRGPPTA